jgi:hypothetical protein
LPGWSPSSRWLEAGSVGRSSLASGTGALFTCRVAGGTVRALMGQQQQIGSRWGAGRVGSVGGAGRLWQQPWQDDSTAADFF